MGERLPAELATYRVDDHVHAAAGGELVDGPNQVRCQHDVGALSRSGDPFGVTAHDTDHLAGRVDRGETAGHTAQAATEQQDGLGDLRPDEAAQGDPGGDAVDQDAAARVRSAPSGRAVTMSARATATSAYPPAVAPRPKSLSSAATA